MQTKFTDSDASEQAMDLTDAIRCTNGCLGHLHDALHGCGAVTALVLLPLIARAASLQADISALIDALNATE